MTNISISHDKRNSSKINLNINWLSLIYDILINLMHNLLINLID